MFLKGLPGNEKCFPPFHEFQAVDANLVKSVCFEYIYDKCPVIAAVGPVENLTDYNRVRSQMYWLRV